MRQEKNKEERKKRRVCAGRINKLMKKRNNNEKGKKDIRNKMISGKQSILSSIPLYVPLINLCDTSEAKNDTHTHTHTRYHHRRCSRQESLRHFQYYLFTSCLSMIWLESKLLPQGRCVCGFLSLLKALTHTHTLLVSPALYVSIYYHYYHY